MTNTEPLAGNWFAEVFMQLYLVLENAFITIPTYFSSPFETITMCQGRQRGCDASDVATCRRQQATVTTFDQLGLTIRLVLILRAGPCAYWIAKQKKKFSRLCRYTKKTSMTKAIITQTKNHWRSTGIQTLEHGLVRNTMYHVSSKQESHNPDRFPIWVVWRGHRRLSTFTTLREFI